MMGTPESVKELIELAGGSLIGKTRLQKTVYLLEAKSVGFGFDFRYHYYGPYSEALATATTDAIALDLIRAELHPSTFGIPYVSYHATHAADSKRDRRHQILNLLKEYDAVTLELAATSHFLSLRGFASNHWEETIRRKREKATPARVEQAKQLLSRLEKI